MLPSVPVLLREPSHVLPGHAAHISPAGLVLSVPSNSSVQFWQGCLITAIASTTHPPGLQYLLHALFGIPRALQLADKNDLPHVIRIVRADVSDFRSPGLQLLVINGFNKLFQFG